MQYRLFSILFILILSLTSPASRAAFVARSANTTIAASSTAVANVSEHSGSASARFINRKLGHSALMPRGQGTGREAVMSCYFGLFCIFPFLCVIFAPLAYLKGIKNMRKRRRGRGFAIAGVAMATLGIAFTLLILLLV